ncbi:Uncharacterised protein [Mycobacteroides abscessus subsp. abscessus]|nr:Uncharacterised protein [Mycobacteroides abscessus subsp. abscessus]
MKPIKVAVSDKQQDSEKTSHRASIDGLPCPVETVPGTVAGKLHIEDSAGDHGPGECHPVVQHKFDEQRVHQYKVFPADAKEMFIIGKNDRCQAEKKGDQPANQDEKPKQPIQHPASKIPPSCMNLEVCSRFIDPLWKPGP